MSSDRAGEAASPETGAAADEEPIFVDEMIVEDNYNGWRLDRFLTSRIRRATRSQVRNYLGNIELEPPRRIKAGTIVRSGDVVRIIRRERILPGVPGPEALQILHRDAELTIISKPPGVLVHRNSREVTHTLPLYLRHHLPDAEHIEAVHRLDRETSGCMLCVNRADRVAFWRAAFHDRAIRKVYVAIVTDPDGRWPEGHEERVDIPLGPDATSTLSLRMGHGTLRSRTDVRALGRVGELALLELHPVEGRQHQLRAHLALSGTPIVGDKLYEAGDDYFRRFADEPEQTMATEPLRTPFHCLHAWRLGLSADGVWQSWLAPLPEHMEALGGATMARALEARAAEPLEPR